MPAQHRHPVARAIAVAAAEESRRRALGLASGFLLAALLLAMLAAGLL